MGFQVTMTEGDIIYLSFDPYKMYHWLQKEKKKNNIYKLPVAVFDMLKEEPKDMVY